MSDMTGISNDQAIDRTDLKFMLFVGIVASTLKILGFTKPGWQINGTDALVAFLLCVGYIIVRGRKHPEKLDEWGITTPLTKSAILVGLLLLALAVGIQAAVGWKLAGKLGFEPSYVPRMIDYVVGAFPQQFLMCSVGLVSLAKLRVFRGMWRLPLAVGIVFSLAHWWTPAKIPGTCIPIQMVLTFPAGVGCVLYFLKFRTIVPLTAIHAIVYILLHNWAEVHL